MRRDNCESLTGWDSKRSFDSTCLAFPRHLRATNQVLWGVVARPIENCTVED
jgi:hypothetical protein